ncbi:hypothetical protein O181_092226 [Austropuccinia psidii MF-1]|uniref:CCHC-type domain-containing protein n=1 Tax=Austropuccinia psidii MF-1 TaxID=1389203 RepID=A0A9Q3IZ26_9BASI|nr:hypothetical protein [Austropuccinia psidii MF-1]
MVCIKIVKIFVGELEHPLKRRFIEPCFTEEYINALEEILKRSKIVRKWKKLDIKSPNKPFINKDKENEPLKTHHNEQRKCHKCGGIGSLANDCLKKAKINEIVETGAHNEKEGDPDS